MHAPDEFVGTGQPVWSSIENAWKRVLVALAPGLTGAGAAELNIVSDFLGFVAKLPPNISKPLFEVAGALLILNKLGVVKVGLQLAGIGGGAGAAAGGAGGLLSKLLGGAVRVVGGVAIMTVAIQIAGSFVPKDLNKQVAADVKKQPPVIMKIDDFLHISNAAAWIDQYFSHPIRAFLENSLPHFFSQAGRVITNIWTTTGHGIGGNRNDIVYAV